MESPPTYDNTKAHQPYPNDPNAGQPMAYPAPGGYPPPQPAYPGPPAGGVGYYPQQQPAPMMYAPPPQGQQQQQQSVVYVNAGNTAPVIVQAPVVESYCGHQAFGCVVFWCCNPLFGLIAWILALVADSTKFQNREEARRLGKASLGMSITGIIVAVIIIAIAVGVGVSNARKYNYYYSSSSSSSSSCYGYTYQVNGYCYNYRRSVSCYNNYGSSSCCYSSETAYYLSSYTYYCYS